MNSKKNQTKTPSKSPQNIYFCFTFSMLLNVLRLILSTCITFTYTLYPQYTIISSLSRFVFSNRSHNFGDKICLLSQNSTFYIYLYSIHSCTPCFFLLSHLQIFQMFNTVCFSIYITWKYHNSKNAPQNVHFFRHSN